MRRVAKEAGCTIGLINHWFTSKEDLVMAAWQEAVDHENESAMQLRAEGRYRADEILLNTLPTTPELRRKELVWQAFAALAIGNPTIRKFYTRHYDYARRVLAETLSVDGEPTPADAEAADLLISATDGIAKMAVLDPARWPPERQRAALRRLIEPHLRVSPAAAGDQKRKVKAAP